MPPPFEPPFLDMPKEVEKTKVSEAVALAQQILELKQRLKLLEKCTILKEFIAYVDGTLPRPERLQHIRHKFLGERPVLGCVYLSVDTRIKKQ